MHVHPAPLLQQSLEDRIDLIELGEHDLEVGVWFEGEDVDQFGHFSLMADSLVRLVNDLQSFDATLIQHSGIRSLLS